MIKYMWNHMPILSAEVKQIHNHYLFQDENNIDELGVVELEDGTFLYVRFVGNSLNMDNGFTIINDYATLTECYEHFFQDSEFLRKTNED